MMEQMEMNNKQHQNKNLPLHLLDNVSLLVLSCDLYEDVWDPYFKLIHKNFENHPCNCYLMTEEKNYNCDFMRVETITTGKGKTWSERVRAALKQINSEYILYSLEDYFIHEPVNEEGFLDAVAQMERNPKWGGVFFHPIKRSNSYPETFDANIAYMKTKRLQKGRTNMMVILYRKAFLEKLLVVDKEDAWAFESNSNLRSIVAGYDVIHYRINHSAPVFKYYNKFIDGVGITSRKWLPRTHEIFEMNGINDVNYNNLGVLLCENPYKDPTDPRSKGSVKKTLSLKEYIYYYIKRPIKNTKIVTLLRAFLCWLQYYKNYKKQ